MFSSGCRRGILSLGAGGGFNPQTLFASGEQGGWWDPSDFSTMFQDSVGTTPVTATTQPVGKILDKSGRGNHRTQATAGSRPTLQVDASGFFYLSYDGVDDSMATGNVDLSGTNKLTAWFGVNKQSDAAQQVIAEHGTVGTDATAISILNAPLIGATASYGAAVRGGGLSSVVQIINAAYAAPVSNVLTVLLDTTAGTIAAQVQVRANGTLPAQTAGGTGPIASTVFGNLPISFGRRVTSFPLNGREYGTIILGRAATVSEIAQGERFIGSRMGIAL